MLFKYYTLDEAEYRAVNQPPIVRHISYTGIIKKVLFQILFSKSGHRFNCLEQTKQLFLQFQITIVNIRLILTSAVN